MTPQEALYNVKRGKSFPYKKETISTISKLCEKQIPKKPRVTIYQYIYNGNHESMFFKHCPNCFDSLEIGYYDSIVDKGSEYCRRCGQRLDWSDNDE